MRAILTSHTHTHPEEGQLPERSDSAVDAPQPGTGDTHIFKVIFSLTFSVFLWVKTSLVIPF
jgi:hypothetical protein